MTPRSSAGVMWRRGEPTRRSGLIDAFETPRSCGPQGSPLRARGELPAKLRDELFDQPLSALPTYLHDGLRREHPIVSWPWLLLPIILTTAFVIFGAWRRAVRDATGEPVEEGE
jgi:hypothetical protein